MIKVTLFYQDYGSDSDAFPHKFLYAENENKFWEMYNSQNEYIKCNDELGYKCTFDVYLKKDKIIDIWIKEVAEVEDENI